MLGFVRRLLLDYYGRTFNTNVIEADFTVGTGIIQLALSKPDRFWITFTNNGAAAIVISTTRTPTATTGFVIPAGSSLGFSWLNDGDISTHDWFAISAAAGNAVHVIEQVASGAPDDESIPA